MRHSIAGGFIGSLRVRRVHFEIWGIAALLALPSGAQSPPGPSPDSNAVKVDQPLPGFSSDEYWRALADLDLAAVRLIARGEPEIAFGEAVSLLAAGDYADAANAFTATAAQTMDPAVAVASQAMLAMTLLHEHKWEMLRDLSSALHAMAADQPNVFELERWGKAFAGIDPQVIVFPDEPALLRLGTSVLGTPMIQVRINGRDYQFWLDTGSTLTVLSSRVAADARITALGDETLRVGTFTGSAPVTPVLLKRMEIGPIVINNTPAMVMDASLLRVKGSGEGMPMGGLTIDGIIGWDVIRQFAVTMDFAAGTISLQRPGNLGTIGTSAQNLTWVGKPFVQVRTTLGDTVQFVLDTGAQSTFVNDAVVRKVRAVTSRPDARVFGIAASGGQSVRLVPLLRLEVAGKSLLMRDLILYTRPSGGLVESDGILGSNIGRFGTIMIDATNGIFAIGE